MASVSDTASLIQAGVAVATLLGSGIAFLWVRVEFNNRRTRRELEKCHKREVMARDRRAVLTTVIELLWQEVTRLVPGHNNNPTLVRAKKLLDDMKVEVEIASARIEAEDRTSHY